MKTNSLFLFFMMIGSLLWAQDKPALDFSTYDTWQRLGSGQLSRNGEWVGYERNYQDADGTLVLTNAKGQSVLEVPRGSNAAFSPDNRYFAFRISPYKDSIREMKRNDVPSDKMPDDSLGIYVMETEKLEKIPGLQGFAVAGEENPWMAWLAQVEKEAAEAPEDTAETEKEEGQEEKKQEKKDLYRLTIANPAAGERHVFGRVKSFELSENGALLTFITEPDDTSDYKVVHYFQTANATHDSLPATEAGLKKFTLDRQGQQVAYMATEDSTDTKVYSLYYWQPGEEAPRSIVDTLTSALPENWTASEHGDMRFSRDQSKLYFGAALRPEPEPEDTLLEEEKVHLDIWHWKDKRLMTQQLAELKDDQKKNYTCVFHTNAGKVVQLEDETLPLVRTGRFGNLNIGLGEHDKSYKEKISYEYPEYQDYYIVDFEDGTRTKICSETQNHASLSPAGKYVYWYNYADSAWYTYRVADGKKQKLTGALDVPLYNEEHDYPNAPFPYGQAGWTEGDEYLLVYDAYDIWQLDPDGKQNPVCLTQGMGRKENLRFRYVHLDEEELFIPQKGILLSAFDKETKADGFYRTRIGARKAPQKLVMEDARFYNPTKAKDATALLWRKSTVKDYPDYYLSGMDFNRPHRISSANPQQEDYNWASVELIEYMTLDGKMEEALLYKPENFDPSKKYPMMVYFYRLHTDGLHRHHTPRASYSIINPLFYASNGYVVLIPNIRYKTGYPGESAFKYVTGATMQLAHEDYIDKDRIGVQGQSWGGYEISYIVTRTDIFRCASPGAPVSNMTSAYGGIRWRSGMVRQFQYEETQSRIGGTLWEKPLHYIENSPVFFAPKINTPLLIRHDDADGAVPWYQGIELFNAMRRLEKPAWLINYNNAPHNLTKKRANRKDWSRRMKQFFDYYLKDAPAPVWLKEGVPALEKGKSYGFEHAE